MLFEAIAYLSDDVNSSSPEIEKIRSDTRRLKDYIAYKVDHSEEERKHFKQQSYRSTFEKSRSTYADHSLSSSSERSGLNVNDSSTYQFLLENGDGNINSNISNSECASMAIRVLESEEEAELLKIEVYDLNLKLEHLENSLDQSRMATEKSDAETANLIGRTGELT